MIALLLLLGCPKPQRAPLDVTLPEQDDAVEAQQPEEILATATASEEPAHRALALASLIRADAEEAGGTWGARALWDPSPWVQEQAAHALSERADEAATRELLEGWIRRPSADPYARASVAVSLRPWAPDLGEAYTEALGAETVRWRQAPLGLAAWVLGDPSGKEPLVAALARGDVALAPGFVASLAAVPEQEAVREALREGTDWIEPELALGYAAARLSLDDPTAEGVLRRALGDDDIGVRLESVDLLGRIDTPATTALLRRTQSHGDELVAGHARLALAARQGGPFAPLLELAHADDPELRATALRAAGARMRAQPDLPRRARRQLEEAIQPGLRDPNGEVRRAAIEAITTARLDPEPVRARLTDGQLSVRLAAAAALLSLE